MRSGSSPDWFTTASHAIAGQPEAAVLCSSHDLLHRRLVCHHQALVCRDRTLSVSETSPLPRTSTHVSRDYRG